MRIKLLILFADAPPSVKVMLNRILQSENYEILWAANVREALQLSRDERPDLLLLDLNRPPRRVLFSLEQLQAANAYTPIILIAEPSYEIERESTGRVAALIKKPFDVCSLLRTMKDVFNPVSEAVESRSPRQHSQLPNP